MLVNCGVFGITTKFIQQIVMHYMLLRCYMFFLSEMKSGIPEYAFSLTPYDFGSK